MKRRWKTGRKIGRKWKRKGCQDEAKDLVWTRADEKNGKKIIITIRKKVKYG